MAKKGAAMRPQERFLTALRGEQPDEVPVSLAIGPTNSRKWVGGEDWRAVYQAHRAVGSIFTYEHVDDPVFTEHWRNGRREDIETVTVRKINGSYLKTRQITIRQCTLTSRELIDQPEYISGQTVEPLLKTRDDYEVYLTYVEEWLDQVEVVESEQIKTMEEEIGDEGVCIWWMTHTYYKYFWVLRSVQEYLLDFHDVPDLMKRVLKTSQKVNERYLQALNRSRCQALVCNLAGASTCIVSPEFFREWVLPELKMLTVQASADKYVGFHLTGKLHDILPLMLEAEPDFVLRFESPRFGGDCSLAEAKEKWGDRVCIMGGYDPHIFALGTREDMRNEAIRCIDEAAAGGGYILANTDCIPVEAELDDVRAMVDTAKQYGRY
jgi:uroporphyrinogen decarboxylase